MNIKILTTILFSIAAIPVWANHHAPIHDTTQCSPDGVALGGLDAVSYHAEAPPLKGNALISTKVGSLNYHFATTENLEKFKAQPSAYIPSYSGWCSTNLSMGRLACPDHANFKIENGKLLLFEHAGFTNGRDIWNADPNTHKKQADANFEKFSH